MNLSRLLVGLLLLGKTILFAQADTCDQAHEVMSPIVAKFSRLPHEKSLQTADSLLSIVKDLDCPKVLLAINIVKGRYDKKVGQMDSALGYYNKALEYAIETNSELRQKDIYVLIAVLTNETGSNLKAIEILDKALDLPCTTDTTKCQKANVKIVINRANYLREKQSYSDAIYEFTRADSLINVYGIPDSIYKVSVYNAIGNIYEEMKDLEQSVVWHRRALEYCPEKHSARFSLFNNIGHRYKKLSKTDSAITFYNKTLENTNVDRYLVTPYQGLGDIAYKLNDSKGAVTAYKKAYEKAIASNITPYVSSSAGLLGKAYYLDGQYYKAKKFMEEFKLTMDPDNTLLEDKIELEKYLLLNELKHSNPSIHTSAESFFASRDTLFDLERQNAIAEMTSRYENRILSDSLATLQLENKNSLLESKLSKLINAIALIALSVLALLGYLLLRRYKEQRALNENLVFEKSELELINSKLKAQIKIKEEKEQQEKEMIPVAKPFQVLDKIEIKSTDKTHLISVQSILYFSAEDNGVRLYLEDGKSLWSDQRLKTLEDKLLGTNFSKIYRSTVVNFSHVDWVNHSSLMMLNGTELKIGRTYKADIKKLFE